MLLRRGILLASAAALLATGPTAAVAQGRRGDPKQEGRDAGPAETKPSSSDGFSEPRTVEVLVTPSGFVPNELTFKKGERIKLVVKRTTDDTCSKVLVIDEYLIYDELPLNLNFSTVFTVGRAGEFPITCPNGETRGVIRVVDESTPKYLLRP
jgi:plastocyanin domain-containing protein